MFKNQKSLSESSEAYRKQTGSRLRAHEKTFTSHQKQSKTKKNATTGENGGLPTKMGEINQRGHHNSIFPEYHKFQNSSHLSGAELCSTCVPWKIL